MLLVTRMRAHSEGRIMLGPHLPAPSLYFPRPFMARGLQTTMEKLLPGIWKCQTNAWLPKYWQRTAVLVKGKDLSFRKRPSARY